MADAAVSLIIEPMISMIQQWLTEEMSLVKNVKKKLENVSSKLKTIRAVLDDAEKRSVQDESVKVWLEELKDISYDMDDVLDEWNTSISRQKLKEAEKPCDFSGEKISCSSLFTCLPLKQVSLRRDITLKIQKIDKCLSSVIEKENAFNFVSKYPPQQTTFVDSLKYGRITTSIIEQPVIYDRDLDKNTLLRKLISDNCQEVNEGIPVISIVGAGGIGKTTLAKQVYNDDEVIRRFSKRIWVCVSDPFSLDRVAREIFAASGGNNLSKYCSLDMLLTHLKQFISNVRFLLVLDDVWDEEGKEWEILKSCLKDGTTESRILVTTRKHRVAEIMGTTHLHHLGVLSQKASWSLFKQIAFLGKKEEDYLLLSKIGKEIVKKCKGLPLAIRTLGSLLRFKNTIKEWEHVLQSQIWQLEKAEVDLFPHLYISYNELSPATKRCFSHCSIFPKDTKIKVDELIRIWIAQGYVVSTDEEDDMELKGWDYFNRLAMCCFFQDFELEMYGRSEKIYKCKMHDIVHDFAQYLTRNECVTIANEMRNTFSKRVQHVTFPPSQKVGSPILTFCNMEKLRTYFTKHHSLQQSLVLFNRLKRVRVLVLYCCDMTELPKEVGNLTHLRYLGLGKNRELNQLPESICELYNLQTLNTDQCEGLSRLPQAIGKLINLRHLLAEDVEFQEYPKSFEKLTNLQTLDKFVVGRKFSKLDYLKNFKHLRGSLKIDFKEDLEEVDILAGAQKAQLKNNKYIQGLYLNFLKVEIGTEAVWEALQPPPSVRELWIRGIYGARYPSWLTKPLNNLKRLYIRGPTPNRISLPPLWKLPCLEELSVESNKSIKYIGRDFIGMDEEYCVAANDGSLRMATASSPSLCAFPKLVSLTFSNLLEWEEWEDLNQEDDDDDQQGNHIQIMPRLQQLYLSCCPNLQKLPYQLLRKASSLGYLWVDCYSFKDGEDTVSYRPSVKQLLSHIPNVKIDGRIHMRNKI